MPTEEAFAGNGCVDLILEEASAALTEAQEMQRLPDDYHDVTLGKFAGIKRWLKRKLLGNFRRAYVDVLSRQQSAYNLRLIAAMQSLMDCCSTLSHAVQTLQERQLEQGFERFNDKHEVEPTTVRQLEHAEKEMV